jgi:hypothetical protein
MGRFFGISMALLLGAALAGCAPPRPRAIVPLPAPDQVSGYAQGQQVFISRTDTSGVGLSLPGGMIQPGKTVDIQVAVSNYSRRPFEFSTGSIAARCGGKSIHVHSQADVLRDEEKENGRDDGNPAVPVDSLNGPGENEDRSGNRREVLFRRLLLTETVLPNGIHNGIVRIAFPSCADNLELAITTGLDVHTFKFGVTVE